MGKPTIDDAVEAGYQMRDLEAAFDAIGVRIEQALLAPRGNPDEDIANKSARYFAVLELANDLEARRSESFRYDTTQFQNSPAVQRHYATLQQTYQRLYERLKTEPVFARSRELSEKELAETLR